MGWRCLCRVNGSGSGRTPCVKCKNSIIPFCLLVSTVFADDFVLVCRLNKRYRLYTLKGSTDRLWKANREWYATPFLTIHWEMIKTVFQKVYTELFMSWSYEHQHAFELQGTIYSRQTFVQGSWQCMQIRLDYPSWIMWTQNILWSKSTASFVIHTFEQILVLNMRASSVKKKLLLLIKNEWGTSILSHPVESSIWSLAIRLFWLSSSRGPLANSRDNSTWFLNVVTAHIMLIVYVHACTPLPTVIQSCFRGLHWISHMIFVWMSSFWVRSINGRILCKSVGSTACTGFPIMLQPLHLTEGPNQWTWCVEYKLDQARMTYSMLQVILNTSDTEDDRPTMKRFL